MATTPASRELLRTAIYPLVFLLLFPLVVHAFLADGRPRLDQRAIAAGAAIPGQPPPSAACGREEPAWADYRAAVCAPYSLAWLTHLAGKVVNWTLGLSVAVLAAGFLLAGLARSDPRLLGPCFTIATRAFLALALFSLLAQTALAIWGAYWGSAVYAGQVLLTVFVPAALAWLGLAAQVIYHMVHRQSAWPAVDGTLVAEEDAPGLWGHVRDLSRELGSRPPDRIVAGIDGSLFVADCPLRLNGELQTGRTLYLALPVLRHLERREADALLVHELGHLERGDGAAMAVLGARVARFEGYCRHLASHQLTVPVYYLLRLLRILFGPALAHHRDTREFVADRAAALLVSPEALARALVKAELHAVVRDAVEAGLWDSERQLWPPLDIARSVDAGLRQGEARGDEARASSAVHPFDAHPSLGARMDNLGVRMSEGQMAELVANPPADRWIDDLPKAEEIESELWNGFEHWFAREHALTLA